MGGPTKEVAPATARPPEILVRRARVDDFLDAVPQYAATLLIAPAGAGKTTAAAAYAVRARDAGRPVTWLRSDRHDLIAEAVAAAAAQDEALDEPPVIVVDDAHGLCTEGVAVLSRALTQQPQTVRLVLLSRRELSWVPVGAVLAGAARTLPVGHLRLTDDEAGELVRRHFPDATADDVAAVLEQAAGWAAAVVLGARALGAAGEVADPRGALAATREQLLDYLAAEVVDSLPFDLVRVLVSTCRLDRVTAEEATLLSGLADAAFLLDRAAAGGLLVTGDREAGAHGWRLHPLLLDLLRRRTASGCQDESIVVDAHRRSVAAYVDRRDAERAIRHAELSDDLDLQLHVIREFAAVLVLRRRPELIAATLAAIPLEVRTRNPDLLVLHAAVLRAAGDLDGAKVAADRAFAAHARRTDQPVPRDVEAELAALGLWQARFGWRESAPAIAYAEEVLGCRHSGRASAHDLAGISPIRANWLILELAAFQVWLGDLDLATIHLQDAAMSINSAELPAVERTLLTLRALLEMAAGAYQSARASADAALTIAPSSRPGDVTAARAHLARGWSQLHALEIAAAQESLVRFEETPRDQFDPLLLAYGRLFRACVLSSSGRLAEAMRLLDHRGDVPGMLPPHVQLDQQMVRMLVEVALGDLTALERTAREMDVLGLPAPAALATALHVGLSGDEARAVRMLDAVDPSAVDGSPTLSLSVAVVRAALLHRAGTASAVEAARACLPDLLSRAAPQRLLSTIAMGALVSPGFIELLGAYARSADAHPFAAEAYAGITGVGRPFPDLVPRRAHGGPADGDPALALTPREREVLEHLAMGGGNADLARALFVSENTVKTHLASIYRKLGVDRRVDALRVARIRGLV